MVVNDSYIKSFVIGSSLPVFMHFFLSVQNIDPKSKNYTYEDYSIVAPLYLGFMNMISLFIGKQFGLNLRERLFYISLISAVCVMGIARYTKSYNYSDKKWMQYMVWIFLKHLFTYNILIYLLEVSL